MSTTSNLFSDHQDQGNLIQCNELKPSFLSQQCLPESEMQLQLSTLHKNYKAFPPQEISSYHMNQMEDSLLSFMLSPKSFILFDKSMHLDTIEGIFPETSGGVIQGKTEHIDITRKSDILKEYDLQNLFSDHQDQGNLIQCNDLKPSFLSEPCLPESEMQLQLSTLHKNYKAFPPQG